MKAVGNHLVLTFCEKSELFTIILTRTKNVFAVDVSRVKSLALDDNVKLLIFIKRFQIFPFYFQDVLSVHELLKRRGLAIQAVRELCRHNSAIRVTSPVALLFTLLAMLLMRN